MAMAREVMWLRSTEGYSLEQARLERGPVGATMSGTVLAAEDGRPLRVDYAVTCDGRWRTRSATVAQDRGGERRMLRLGHDGDGAWTLDGRPAAALAGCTDVDLGISPMTNALPVNRLSLAVGAAATIRAAWVLFPGLEVVAAEQSYTRLGDRRYRFRGLASGFEAEIEVDADGLPVDYADIWRRVAADGAGAGGIGGA